MARNNSKNKSTGNSPSPAAIQLTVSAPSAKPDGWGAPSVVVPFVGGLLAAAIPVVLSAYVLRETPTLTAHSLVVPPAQAPVIAPLSSASSDGVSVAAMLKQDAASRPAAPMLGEQEVLPSRSALEQIRITELAAKDVTTALDPSLREAYNEIVQDAVKDMWDGNHVSEHQNLRRMNQFLIDKAPDVFKKFGPQMHHGLPETFPFPRPDGRRPGERDALRGKPSTGYEHYLRPSHTPQRYIVTPGSCFDESDLIVCS